MKTCTGCNQVLEKCLFYLSRGASDGLTSRCRECTKRAMSLRRARIRAQMPPGWKQKTKDRKAYMKAWHDANPGYRHQAKKRWLEKNPERARVREVFHQAVRSGKIVPQPCSVCGTVENIHGHHHDYSKPLEVTWLCQAHHIEIHKKLKAEVA